ncbi:hypothetical protein M406DRAFT_265907 [Cryphonectria parasitica EP155]|uniref:DUF676 domain-containing protein n=1 Tax=Cryphonectria parasitica (strain ATCC 38755 / EP155) TaxID=660469 RepID=A0A9P4XVT3_CRYP1|nr:uncharacterized protein M406DRAFT_265907 [Cryphonectria parasitica EP155]KAF3761836.1 hypothetical protein M406DRAFT_265907 [Cryphonectria parasitica EP155]
MDSLDNSHRLADVCDNSLERPRSEPVPSTPAPDEKPGSVSGLVEAKDHQLSAATAVADSNDGASNRTSISHWAAEPGFAHIDGEIGGSGYNETRVDIITVPCPGADPLVTWTRDPLPDGYFGNFPKAAHLWVKQGIRRFADTARVLLYRHRELVEGVSLDSLAQDLLENVLLTRDSQQTSRPIFFIAHSVGGLVVKRALLMARLDHKFRTILYNCHGISFFATPHRGSSYMSMPHLSESIQSLLCLRRPLPRSIARDLRVNNKDLLKMHEGFADIASEMRIWTFYETIDSQLSGSGMGIANEVSFTAPLVSIKSALVGARQEIIYSSLESDHAHCASFGISNPRTLRNYLLNLAEAIAKAETLCRTTHTPLKLKDVVKVEVVGFYEDPDAATESDVRLYTTKYHLSDFLSIGPERCLEERLRRVRRPGSGGHPFSSDHADTDRLGRGVVKNVQEKRSTASRLGLGIAPRSRSEKLSKSSILQELSAGFSRPDPNRRKFMWIHLPFTNPLWDIFDKLSETHKQDFSRLFGNEHWVSRHVQGRHSQSQPCFIKPAVNFITDDSATSPRASHSSSTPPSTGPSPKYLYVYLPYLHFDTYRHMIKRRRLIEKRLAHGRTRPVPEEIANLDSLELRVIWEFLGHDPPLNGRRTLDQFGYPSLKDTHARDDDQMLYKLTKQEKFRPPPPAPLDDAQSIGSLEDRYSIRTKQLHEMIERDKGHAMDSDSDSEALLGLRDGNLLMVDQLWLWAIDTTTLTTFFPKRESRPSEGALFQQADLRNSIYHELNGDLTGRCENSLDLAAFVVLHAVTVLLDRSSHPDLEVFRIFEEAIGMLTERMTSNLKKFRMQSFKEADLDSDEEPEDNTAASIKKRHKREIERAERENRENTSALLELRDMEDELKTFHRLFDTQVTMIEKMLDMYTGDSLKDLTHYGQGYLREALTRLAEYKAQTTEMLERVTATRGDYEKLLEMAQRQAQVDDVRWSRLQTELASSQNLSVMIFTIFTVIFLPLSFFTSLFGMNTLEWGGADAQYPSLGYIGEISLPVSVFMILATLVAAFSSHVQVAFKSLFRRLYKAWVFATYMLKALEPEASRRAQEIRRAEREREEREEKQWRRKERSYDFWATVRAQRTLGSYEIPDLNRNLVRSGTTGFSSSANGVGRGWVKLNPWVRSTTGIG